MIFLTVGTQFPFDRLVQAVDDIAGNGLIDEEIFAQIGKSSYKPQNFAFANSLDKKLFDNCVRKASTMISHAGVGTIMAALDNKKPLIVMPRLKKYGEVVNNHQFEIARKFEELGHVITAYNEEDLPGKIKQVKSFIPQAREDQIAVVVDRIAGFLNRVSSLKKHNIPQNIYLRPK